jgi:acyl-CoA thioester hydrolase
MRHAFYPEEMPESFPRRENFPQPPPPPPGLFSMKMKVAWHDLDPVKHVNNANYIKYTEECGLQVIAAHGWPISRMIDNGFAIFIRQHRIKYIQPARLGDELLISTWASNVRRSSATRHYLIQRGFDRKKLAIIHTKSVWVDLETGRPVRIPESLLSDFSANIIA